jgi:transposase
LSPPQKRRLVRLLAKGPLAHGCATDIWTCDRVRRLIWREFRVRYHRDHVGRLLHQRRKRS